MKRFIAAVVAAALLVLPGSLFAVSDMVRPAISRLWTDTDDGHRFTCTVSYLQPYINDYMSWVITAGHCASAGLIARNEAETVWGVVDWRIVIREYGSYTEKITDVALGTVPDVRDKNIHNGQERLWIANDNSKHGDRVYIHGFPRGIEQVSWGVVVGDSFLSEVKLLVQTSPWDLEWKAYAEIYRGSHYALVVPKDSIAGGSSGSPVLNQDGRVVGILWGLIPNDKRGLVQGIPEGYDLAMFTPIERIIEIMKTLGVN